MTTTADHWYSYWSDKSTPQYAYEDDAHYRAYAAELRLLFPEPAPARVLEIGCGSGTLFRHLGFDRSERYVGVDFSKRMLATFRAAEPDVDLVYADGASYRENDRFNLIFSSQVAQYWTCSQLAHHLDNAAGMLAPGGAVVVSGVPWTRMRMAYARGDLTGGARRSLPHTLASFGGELVLRRLGQWYDLPDLERLAARCGLRVQHRGSMHYPYRFHAVFRS